MIASQISASTFNNLNHTALWAVFGVGTLAMEDRPQAAGYNVNESAIRLNSDRSVMFTSAPEQNRHGKSDNRPETDPPGNHEHWQPARLSIELRAENAGNTIGQPTQDRQ